MHAPRPDRRRGGPGILPALLLLTLPSMAHAGGIVGRWTSIDDRTGEPRSVIEIYDKRDGTLGGKVLRLLRGPEEDPDPVCLECPPDKRGRKVIGLEIIWNLRPKNDGWQGRILDPESGKVYRCKMSLDGDGLRVRGFVGVSLLGRTQVWQRAD